MSMECFVQSRSDSDEDSYQAISPANMSAQPTQPGLTDPGGYRAEFLQLLGKARGLAPAPKVVADAPEEAF